jgi:parvulin-like peptidyl-prolyl isomerase
MPYLINGQPLREELVRQEEQRSGCDIRWKSIADEAERARHLRAAAEQSAIEKTLVEQAAVDDPRPIDAALIEQEVARQKAMGGCRGAFDDSLVRQWIERHLRVQRTVREMIAGAAKPTAEQVRAFYIAQRDNFRTPETFDAAHILKHVNHEQSEEQALAGIQAALAELEEGKPFAEVANRHSDCKEGRGGDLGQFRAGVMVADFENALRAVKPGQRSGIFTTPFGFPHRGAARQGGIRSGRIRGCTRRH